jgi:putative peptidoglycan lipid II flippase
MILTFLGMVFAPVIVRLLYPGSDAETVELAVRLCRLMYPYLFFIGLSSTFIAILNSHNVFFITGLSSGLLNIGWMLMLVLGYFVLNKESEDLVLYAGYGVLLGGFLQTVINLPFLKRIGYNFKVILRFKTIAMQTLWKRFLPAMFGMGVREINLLASALIASFLPVGSISALGFGNRLMQLPLGIFGVSVGTAALPEYSRLVTEKKWDDLSKTLNFSMLLILYILLPITVVMMIGSEIFVRLLFERGKFGENAVQMTKLALMWFSAGLCFYGWNQVITPIFFAFKDTKTPVKIGAYIVGLNIVLSIVLMQFMAHAGIAFATSLTAMVNFIVLLYLIPKKFPEVNVVGFNKNALKMCFVFILMSGVLIVFVNFYTATGFWELLLKCVLFLLLALISAIGGFHLVKPDYYKEVVNKVLKRFLRKRS